MIQAGSSRSDSTNRTAAPLWNSISDLSVWECQYCVVSWPSGTGGSQVAKCARLASTKSTIACSGPGCSNVKTRRSVSRRGGFTALLESGREGLPFRRPELHRHALEAALGELVPSAKDKSDQAVSVGVHIPAGGQSVVGNRKARTLAQRGFEAVMKLIDAGLQSLVLIDQHIADQDACHAWILLRKCQQHGYGRLDLFQATGLLGVDLVDQGEHALLYELDQPLEHLRLARKMPV